MEGSNRNVFWGLVIKPGKRYETTVQEPFRITKVGDKQIYNSLLGFVTNEILLFVV